MSYAEREPMGEVEATTAPAVPRLEYIDQIRAMAALYVALFHALLVLWPLDGSVSPPWYLGWVNHGHFGVAVFIVVSGFSLAWKPAVRRSTTAGRYWPFMLKRGLRLLPPYWIALAGSVTLLYLAPSNVAEGGAGAAEWAKGPVPLRSILGFGFLVQDFFRLPSPNSPMWSIAVEWHLYFLFPLLVFLGCRYGMRWLIVGSTVVGLTLHELLRHTSAASTTPHFLVLFTMGIVTAYAVRDVVDSPPAWTRRVDGWYLVGASFLIFIALSQAEVAADLVAGSVFALGLFSLGCRRQVPTAEPGPAHPVGHTLALIGLVSYSLYLVHSPAEKIVWHFVVEPLDLNAPAAFVVLTVIGIAASLVGAYVLYLVIERRSMSWSRGVRASTSP